MNGINLTTLKEVKMKPDLKFCCLSNNKQTMIIMIIAAIIISTKDYSNQEGGWGTRGCTVDTTLECCSSPSAFHLSISADSFGGPIC